MRRLLVPSIFALAACRQAQSPAVRAKTPASAPAPELTPPDLASGTSSLAPLTASPEAMRVGPGVTEPVEITRVKPRLVQNKNLGAGVIILEGIITADGKVEKVRVLRPVSPEADEAAVEAVRQWRYRPATYQGRPVPVYLTVTVNICPM